MVLPFDRVLPLAPLAAPDERGNVPDHEPANILHLVQQQVRAGLAELAPKVDPELYALDMDEHDVWDAIIAATAAEIRKCEPDHSIASRVALVLRLPVADQSIYCKVTVNPEIDHSPRVLSFHPWGRT